MAMTPVAASATTIYLICGHSVSRGERGFATRFLLRARRGGGLYEPWAVTGGVVSVSLATRVRLIFAGWLPAGRCCSGGAFRLSRRRAWQRKPLLLIARSRVRSARCHISVRSPPGWLCLSRGSPREGWLGSPVRPSAARPTGRPPGLPVSLAWQGSQRLRGQGRPQAVAQRSRSDP